MTALSRNQLISSAAGTLEALEVLGMSAEPLSLAEIARATGKPKGTAHRMVATLVNTGFVEQDADSGRYRLTMKAWRIGARAMQNLDLVERTRAALERLRADTQETVHLAVFDPSGNIVYVAKLASPRSIGVQTYLGQLSPAWCTATGRALLAFNPEAATRALSGRLEKRTPRTVTDPAQLRKIIEGVRSGGYSVAQAENHPEMGGVAAPVRNHEGNVVAAVGVAVPEYRMTKEAIEQLIPRVVRAAHEASFALGHEETGGAVVRRIRA
jgi:DNA-binding IclR family transcriptional regulator